MAIENPTKYVSVQRLGRFEEKLEQKYATQTAMAATYATKAELEAASTATMFQLYVDPTDMHLKGKPTGYGTFEVVNGHLILHQTE